jgi:hypothetical protein
MKRARDRHRDLLVVLAEFLEGVFERSGVVVFLSVADHRPARLPRTRNLGQKFLGRRDPASLSLILFIAHRSWYETDWNRLETPIDETGKHRREGDGWTMQARSN